MYINSEIMESAEDLRSLCRSSGIDIMDSNGRYRSTYAIIDDIYQVLFTNNNKARGTARRIARTIN